MSKEREALIRNIFDISTDILFAETSSPGEGHLREAFNQFMEKRDWSWWKEEAQRCSTERLKVMQADRIEQAEDLGIRGRGR